MTSSAKEPTRLAGAGDYVEWLRLSVHEKPIPSTNRARAEEDYVFATLEQLLEDFRRDVENWR